MTQKRTSLFGEEWRNCLREYAKYVVGVDMATKDTTIGVLYQVGFTENEVLELQIEATMLLDEVPSNPLQTFTVHPGECTCPACMDGVLDKGHDKEGQPENAD